MTYTKDPVHPPIMPSGRRRGPGPRSQRRRDLRKTAAKRRVWQLMGLTLVVAALSAAIALWQGVSFPRREATPTAVPAKATQETWLIVGRLESNTTGDADWISVAATDPAKGEGLMMYVPRSTYVEIPGHGLDTLDKSLGVGKETLLASTTTNLLGVEFDHYLTISDQGIQALFDKVGPLTVEVHQKLNRTDPDGRSRVVFAEGKQPLDGKRVAEYLNYVNESGDEISRGARHSVVWSSLIARFQDSPRSFGKVLLENKDLYSTDANPGEVDRFFASMASIPKDSFTFETLPVKATGVSSGIQSYAPDRDAIAKLVSRYLKDSKPDGAGKPGRRIEILNGNGRPGIGQEVSSLLLPKGFRVVLDQNAKSFGYEITQIVVYSDSRAALAVGAEIKKVLGVGEIVISRHKQTLVDVTIVVGKDYLERKG